MINKNDKNRGNKDKSKSMYDIERGLISQLIATKDIAFIQDQQIKREFFSGDNQNIFRYIQEYYTNHSDVPTVRIIEQKYPNYKFEYIDDHVGTAEPLSYWCEEIRKKVKFNLIADLAETIGSDLNNFNLENAYLKLKQGLYSIDQEIEISTDVDVTQGVKKRKEIYEQKKKTRGMLGISYGLPQLDYYTKGLENGTLTTLIARTGVGKALTLNT